MDSDAFERSRLSAREDAILEAAIEGLTDIQIALRLDISQSTVNSYWGRIRGKLGQQSRTELVARALKAESHTKLAAATELTDRLQAEARVHARISADYERAEILRAALDAMPEAVFVSCHRGQIRYVNIRLEAMFGYATGELIDQRVEILLPDSTQEPLDIPRYLENPQPLRLGLDRAVYGQRKDGSQFRIVLLVDAQPTSTGPIATCVVRDFTTEIATLRATASP